MIDATKAPAVGDVVRIGDLPAGAECEWMTTSVKRALTVRVPTRSRTAVTVCTYDEVQSDTLVRVTALPMSEPESIAHWHRKATEAEAECERLRASAAEIRRHLGIAADEATVDGVKRLFRAERAQAFADYEKQSAAERAEVERLRAEIERLTAERQSFAAETALAACAPRDATIERLTAERDEAVRAGIAECNRREKAEAERDEAKSTRVASSNNANMALLSAYEARDAARANYSGALADIAEMCRVMGEADATAPVGKAQAWADEREEQRAARTGLAKEWHTQCVAARREVASLTAHLKRTQAELRQALDGREAERARAEELRDARDAHRSRWLLLCDAILTVPSVSTYDATQSRSLAEVSRMRAEISARDAQEAARVAEWDEVTGRRACARCWYPSGVVGVRSWHQDGSAVGVLCDACRDDNARDSAAKEVTR